MPIMDKFIKTPKIGDIVAGKIDSGVNSSVTFIRSSAGSPSEPKGNQSTVSPAGSSSMPQPQSTKASRLREKAIAAKETATQGASKIKKVFSGSSKGGEKKEPKPTAKPNLVTSTTMTIEKIQQRLNSLIKGDFPIRLIGLISANHETINKEINSGNNKIIDLVDKAANVKATSKGKTAYQMAEDKDNKEFLEVKDNEEFLEVVDNARKRLAELKNRQSKSKLEKVDEVCKEPQIVPQSVAPRLVNLDRSKSRTLNDLTIEEVQQKLENAIKDKEISSIINLISDNHEIIKKSIEKSGDTDFMELILQAAHCVKDESMRKTASNLAKEQNNLIFLDVIQNVFKKLCELNSRLYQLDPESALNRQKSFYKLTYIPEIEEMHEKQEMRSVKSCPDLTTLGSTPSVEEGGKNNEDETPPDVTEEGGDHESIGILKFSKSEENFLSWSDFDILPTNGNNIKTSTELTPRPSTDQDLHESDSDTDSGIGGSPVSSPKKTQGSLEESVGLLTSRRGSLSSRIESLNSGDDEKTSGLQPQEETKSELQEEFPPAAKLLPLLNKGKPKGPSGRRASSRPLRNHEDRTQEGEPALVVIPASTIRVTLPPQEKEPALDTAKAPDRVTKEPKVIKPEEEKENTLLVRQKPAANGNSDKNIPLKKQSNNRSFCFAAIAICTLGAASCFAIAGFMSAKKTPALATPPVVAIALCVIGIVFIIAATTWCLTPPPSSELSPMDLTHQAAVKKEVS